MYFLYKLCYLYTDIYVDVKLFLVNFIIELLGGLFPPFSNLSVKIFPNSMDPLHSATRSYLVPMCARCILFNIDFFFILNLWSVLPFRLSCFFFLLTQLQKCTQSLLLCLPALQSHGFCSGMFGKSLPAR